jgi:hypothetical protein
MCILVNDGSLGTEVMRVGIGYRGTGGKKIPFGFNKEK